MKTTLITTPVLIEKEAIHLLQFPNTDVLDETSERSIREFDLQQATKLGNIEKHKVEIIFEDAQGMKKVKTTIWATTQNNIVLKSGVIIPINRVYRVKF